MPQIIILKADGTTRTVEENTEFRLAPGERVGRSTTKAEDTEVLIELSKTSGVPLGDMIARATKAFGIKPCSSCEKRQNILNKVKELGLLETARQLKETF